MSQSPTALRGNIRHSVVSWPFQVFGEQWDLDTVCRTARELGAESVELVDPEGWPTLAKYGLTCAIAAQWHARPTFRQGPQQSGMA